MVRMIAILAGSGPDVRAGWFGFARNSSAVQVTFFGSGCRPPIPRTSRIVGPTTFGSKPVNDDCYAYLKPGNNDPLECNYTLGFRAGDTPVAAAAREGRRHARRQGDRSRQHPDRPATPAGRRIPTSPTTFH
jgi:hypothetical protein